MMYLLLALPVSLHLHSCIIVIYDDFSAFPPHSLQVKLRQKKKKKNRKRKGK
ncbi:hypothetical protein MTR_4g117230 [Medicago truncatula]|uniref:Transmembrane protein n=1 Tax=Medicago truncatula TaxID=3880 RepID=A0A072UQT0_MEDTR|nr:hypothetical protein MTR_4g117230 [Medicago truncatula]